MLKVIPGPETSAAQNTQRFDYLDQIIRLPAIVAAAEASRGSIAEAKAADFSAVHFNKPDFAVHAASEISDVADIVEGGGTVEDLEQPDRSLGELLAVSAEANMLLKAHPKPEVATVHRTKYPILGRLQAAYETLCSSPV